MEKIVGVILLVCFSSLGQCQSSEPVKISTYYESLCPDSIRFFTEQLEPAYDDVGEIMTVEINTYGFVTEIPRPSGEGYIFDCQHGKDECYGNMILECGKKYIPDNTTYLNYAFCVMGADYPPSSGASCAAEVGVSFEPIEQCSNSTEGELILHEVGVAQSQLDPSVFYVPWIIVNDEFSAENLDAAQTDLKGLVCTTYEGELPSECLA